MTGQKQNRKRISAKRSTNSRCLRHEAERVMRELEAAGRQNSRQTDPIVERLRQCPEAFKAGELIGKMLDSLKYNQGPDELADRHLPPAGVAIPPFA